MDNVLAPGSSGLGSSPGQGHCVMFLGKTLYSQCLSPPRCIIALCLANLMLGVTLQWTSIPSRGSRNTPSRFMLQKLEKHASLMSHLTQVQTFF